MIRRFKFRTRFATTNAANANKTGNNVVLVIKGKNMASRGLVFVESIK